MAVGAVAAVEEGFRRPGAEAEALAAWGCQMVAAPGRRGLCITLPTIGFWNPRCTMSSYYQRNKLSNILAEI